MTGIATTRLPRTIAKLALAALVGIGGWAGALLAGERTAPPVLASLARTDWPTDAACYAAEALPRENPRPELFIGCGVLD